MQKARILYLDQNKWIELAQAFVNPIEHETAFSVLERLATLTAQGRLYVPLSAANIDETHKTNDKARRAHLASVQATLSQGKVFRGRRPLLRAQIAEFLSKELHVDCSIPAPNWFLSNNPFEFAGDDLEVLLGIKVPEAVGSAIERHPAAMLHSFLTDLSDDIRRKSVENWSSASKTLIAKIASRRERIIGQSAVARERAYAAGLLIGELDFIFETAFNLGLPVGAVGDLRDDQWRALISNVPILDVEVSLVSRIESETRPVDENDLRDVLSFTTAISFSDFVVGEKASISRAKQARLDRRYPVKLLTSLGDLYALLSE